MRTAASAIFDDLEIAIICYLISRIVNETIISFRKGQIILLGSSSGWSTYQFIQLLNNID